MWPVRGRMLDQIVLSNLSVKTGPGPSEASRRAGLLAASLTGRANLIPDAEDHVRFRSV